MRCVRDTGARCLANEERCPYKSASENLEKRMRRNVRSHAHSDSCRTSRGVQEWPTTEICQIIIRSARRRREQFTTTFDRECYAAFRRRKPGRMGPRPPPGEPPTPNNRPQRCKGHRDRHGHDRSDPGPSGTPFAPTRQIVRSTGTRRKGSPNVAKLPELLRDFCQVSCRSC
jgi:hypothetical protein